MRPSAHCRSPSRQAAATRRCAPTGDLHPEFLRRLRLAIGALEQAVADGTVEYMAPLPNLVQFDDGIMQPADYYAANGITPSTTIAGNDFATLAPLFDSGALPANTVKFGAGINLSDLQFSWGTTEVDDPYGSMNGEYATLNITWGQNQGIQVVMPHFNDPIGSGVQEFTFADRTKMSMAEMIALAPPAPTFDPEIFVFQPGMGQQVLPDYATQLMFETGIDFSNLKISTDGNDLLLSSLNGSDVLRITGGAADSGWASGMNMSFANGDWVNYTQYGPGEYEFDRYDAQTGNWIGDLWAWDDGTYGSDTYNVDGSSSGIIYNADGSYGTYVDDGQGDVTNYDYSAAGFLLDDNWTKADGSQGDDTFNADGSSNGDTYNADGSYSTYVNDGMGNVTTEIYDANGTLIGDSWSMGGRQQRQRYVQRRWLQQRHDGQRRRQLQHLHQRRPGRYHGRHLHGGGCADGRQLEQGRRQPR